MNGGSIRLFIAHINSKYKEKNKNINKILKLEKKYLLKFKKKS